MTQRIASALLVLSLSLALPAGTVAQPGIYLGGGATFPRGTFKDCNNHTGWMGQGRLTIPVQQGLSVVASGFYGTNDRNSLCGAIATSKLTGLMGGLLYRVGDPDRRAVFFFWEGGLVRQETGGLHERRIAYSGAVGYAIPLAAFLELRLTGSYLGVLFNSEIAFWGLTAGIHVRMGGKRH
jgi:hypothetical protein